MLFGAQKTGLDALLNRPRPTKWQQFWSSPCKFLAHFLYTLRRIIHEPPANPVSIVCISDTHNSQPHLPFGDILIHAGDLTQSGTLRELEATIAWLNSQPHTHKIIIAGNHDILLDKGCDRREGDAVIEEAINWGDCIYLQNETTTITCSNGRSLKIYGSPLSPRYGNWSFQYPRSQDVWSGTTPNDIDVLVTHGPPFAHLDLNLGCYYLLQELWRIRPLLHVFGHAHEGYGQESVVFDRLQKTYEKALCDGNLWSLMKVFKEFLRSLPMRKKQATTHCQLVNSAMVGGLRDNEKREPIKVII
ncbi:Metallo-dependent phosphatase-like protein [Fusarium redolens]|uniref:Metallo-dependent phosphatase-like protein n=1 Tax=Fusarium redolens TaxID=48865 RepID=A0A9P9HF68_FUSRE|nr:Metallo-dependent phosphatase-like protein [Fusarium redolens]KAH7255833.1 Metallo-dependent phosphatase-like protein [Fusarium redolens]